MKLIIGLGNPGSEYSHTRHNVGFDAVDYAAAFFQTKLKKRCLCNYRYAKVPGGIIVQPLTFMNKSGLVLRHFRKYNLKASDIMVVCDNMDLGTGGIRIKNGGGNGGQKGLNSIQQFLGSSDFIRLFIGTGRPAEGVQVIDHVLSKETDPAKAKELEKAVEDAAKAIEAFIGGEDVAKLQSVYNRKGLL